MKVIIHNGIQAYMTVFEPKAINNGDPCFSSTIIIDDKTRFSVPEMGLKKVKHTELEKVSKQVVHAKFGKNTPKDKNWSYNKADGSTTRDQYVNDEGDYHDGFDDDTFYVSAKKYPEQISKSKCGQFDAGELLVMGRNKKRINAQDGNLKPGDRVNVVTDFYAFESDGTKGVTASLEGMQKWEDGTALKLGGGSSISAGDDFEEGDMPDSDDAADLM